MPKYQISAEIREDVYYTVEAKDEAHAKALVLSHEAEPESSNDFEIVFGDCTEIDS